MTKTIVYTHIVSNAPTEAFSVALATADSSYGVKKTDTGTVVVSSGTSVTTTPDVGVYEYEFTVEEGVRYSVSWAVVSEDGDPIVYTTETVGPFTDTDNPLRVTPSIVGSPQLGGWMGFSLDIRDKEGNPIDVDSVSLSVQRNSNGVVVLTETPENIRRGNYVYAWAISGLLSAGSYDAYWTYAKDGVGASVPYKFVINKSGTGTSDTNTRYISIRLALESLIPCLQEIPRYREESRNTGDNKTYIFNNNKWNQAMPAVVYRNRNAIYTGFQIDYLKGLVVFDKANLSEDVVEADYSYRFFDDEKLRVFLENGIQSFNIYPPHTQYTLGGLPDRFVPPVLYQAATDAFRTFQQCLFWPQNRALFESEDLAKQTMDSAQQLSKEYKEQAKELSEQKKLFPYSGLNKAILNSFFSLAGGRARMFRYMFGGGGAT